MIRFYAQIALTICLILSARPSQAQYFPGHEDLYVNDYADMLSPETEDTLRRKLNYLKEDIGTEMSILTINDMATYGDWTDIAKFGTGIFNQWGIGDAERNDGLLLLISKNDRELRIVVGSGYAPIYDDISEDIIQFYITPAFKDGDFDDGVLDGTQKMISLMALPFNSGEESPERPKNPNGGVGLVLWGMGLFFGGAIGAAIFGPKYSRYRFSRKPCPQCGQTGMSRDTRTVKSATKTTSGMRETTIVCSNCSYHDVSQTTISRISSSNNRSGSGGSGFGGGSSSGGGASGKW